MSFPTTRFLRPRSRAVAESAGVRLVVVAGLTAAVVGGGLAVASSGVAGGGAVRDDRSPRGAARLRMLWPLAVGLSRPGGGGSSVLVGQLARSNSEAFADPVGDSGNAPDVTSVVVSNDDAGTIYFRVSVANRSTLGADDLLAVTIDTDANAASGSNDFDFVLSFVSGHAGLVAWNGSAFMAASAPSLSGSFAASVLTVAINRSELNNTSGFYFGIAASGDGGTTTAEVAPDNSLWHYQLSIGPPAAPSSTTTATQKSPGPSHNSPGLTAISLYVSKATAGQAFLIRLVVRRSDNQQPLDAGTVTCSATLASKPLRLAAKTEPHSGISNCLWRLPTSARGKQLTGTITDTFDAAIVRRTFYRSVT
jgi:hypothetical protein